MFDYYKAWDKFATKEDKAEGDSSEEAGEDGIIPAKNPTFVPERPPQSQAEMMKRTSGARPNTKVVIKGGSVKKNSSAD